jgi:hypothetical protein
VLSFALKEKVSQYIDSVITLEELEEWYVPRLPQFLAIPDSADADVVAAVELALVEFESGLRDEVEVKELLDEALKEQPTVVVSEHKTLIASSSNQSTSLQAKPVSSHSPLIVRAAPL